MRDYMFSLSGMGAMLIMDASAAGLVNGVQGFKTNTVLGDWLLQNVEKTAPSCRNSSIVSIMIGARPPRGENELLDSFEIEGKCPCGVPYPAIIAMHGNDWWVPPSVEEKRVAACKFEYAHPFH